MIDPKHYRESKIAPRAVFDALLERRGRPRFMVRGAGGAFEPVTWGAFADQIRHAALYLASVGIVRGDRVAIFAPNRVEWMSAALAIQAAGGVMVPIYPASTASQAAYVVGHSDAKVVFVDTAALLRKVLSAWSDYAAVSKIVLLDAGLDASLALLELRGEGREVPSVAEVEAKIVSFDEALRMGAARDAEAPTAFAERMDAVSLEDGAIMLYTSGTTGHPKGVPLTHENIVTNGRDWYEINAPLLDEGVVDLLWLPMSHIFGLGEACIGNTLGYVTYLCEPHEVIELLPVVKPHVFMSVPAYWEKLAQRALDAPDAESRRARLAEVTGGRLRFCLSGGAGLKREVKDVFYQCGLLIIEGYGLTECSPTLTLNRPDDFRFDSVGKVVPSVELKLAEDGEILARGKSIFGGYHKEPEATREAFTDDGWFKTGDVGRFTDDGFLQIIDRKKEILVTAGGKNVPPANIEVRFADSAVVEHVVVYGDGKRYLVAGVWLNHAAIDAELVADGDGAGERSRAAFERVRSVVDQVNEGLASFERIKRFRIIDTPLTVASGLLTTTLKVRRKKVYEAFAREFESLYEERA